MLSATRIATKYLASSYSGNPDDQGIYQNTVDHGYEEALSGGTDVMQRLQNQFRIEQGREPRPEGSKVAARKGQLRAELENISLPHFVSVRMRAVPDSGWRGSELESLVERAKREIENICLQFQKYCVQQGLVTEWVAPRIIADEDYRMGPYVRGTMVPSSRRFDDPLKVYLEMLKFFKQLGYDIM